MPILHNGPLHQKGASHNVNMLAVHTSVQLILQHLLQRTHEMFSHAYMRPEFSFVCTKVKKTFCSEIFSRVCKTHLLYTSKEWILTRETCHIPVTAFPWKPRSPRRALLVTGQVMVAVATQCSSNTLSLQSRAVKGATRVETFLAYLAWLATRILCALDA